MARSRADRELVALLEQMLTAARAGELRALWAVYQGPEGYDCSYLTPDLEDMVVQVRTELINTQTALSAMTATPAPARKH